jgi:hypothetical protein
MGMKNLNDLSPGRSWSDLYTESESWPCVKMRTGRYDLDRFEILDWLKEADFDGYYIFGFLPKWDEYMTVALENKNAAFAFKMRFGGL